MFLTKTMRNIHNKTTQYKHRNLNHAHWKSLPRFMNLLNQPGPILKRTQNMILYWNQVGLRGFCYLGFIWTWNLKLKSKDGTQKSSSWRKSFWYDQWEISDFSFFFFFKWSNQGMYAIRLWIIWYDCTHIFGECSEGRHSRGTQVADTCLIHEETPSVSVKDICPPGYNQDTQESESPKFCITTIRENYKLSLVIERQKE